MVHRAVVETACTRVHTGVLVSRSRVHSISRVPSQQNTASPAAGALLRLCYFHRPFLPHRRLAAPSQCDSNGSDPPQSQPAPHCYVMFVAPKRLPKSQSIPLQSHTNCGSVSLASGTAVVAIASTAAITSSGDCVIPPRRARRSWSCSPRDLSLFSTAAARRSAGEAMSHSEVVWKPCSARTRRESRSIAELVDEEGLARERRMSEDVTEEMMCEASSRGSSSLAESEDVVCNEDAWLTVEEVPVQLRLAELSDEPHAVVERRQDLGVGREHRSEAVVELDEDAFEHAPEAEQVHEEGDWWRGTSALTALAPSQVS